MSHLQFDNGQNIFEQFKEVFIQKVPFCQFLDLKIDNVDAERAVMSFSMQDKFIGNILNGGMHGGVTAAVLDSVGGLLAMLSVISRHQDGPAEQLVKMLGRTSTINLNINYLSPGKGNHFKASAKTLHTGNKIYRARMILENDDDVRLAEATGVYLIG